MNYILQLMYPASLLFMISLLPFLKILCLPSANNSREITKLETKCLLGAINRHWFTVRVTVDTKFIFVYAMPEGVRGSSGFEAIILSSARIIIGSNF